MTALEIAAYDLYRAGRWILPADFDLTHDQQAKLWEKLRDALRLPPGRSL